MRHAVIIAIAGMLAGAVFKVAQVLDRNAPCLVFEPPLLTIPQDVEEFEAARVGLTLANRGRESATIDYIAPSCPCVHITRDDGVSMKEPCVLEPGTAIVFAAEIDTAGRAGPQQLTVLSTGVSESRQVQAMATILLNVRSAWRATPEEVIFRDVEAGIAVSSTVEIRDALADPGILIKDVVSSAPDRIIARVLPEAESLLQVPDANGKLRHRLEVRYSPGESPRDREEVITLVPQHSKYVHYRPLYLRVLCQNRKPDAALRPAKVVFVNSIVGQKVTRSVVCTTPQGATVTLISAPRFAKITIRDSKMAPNENFIDIECVIPDVGERRKAEASFLVAGKTRQTLKMPIEFFDIE